MPKRAADQTGKRREIGAGDDCHKRSVDTYDRIYDAYNGFLMSEDTYVLGKMVARIQLFQRALDLPGDIVECGVFKGAGLLLWLKLVKLFCPNSLKKVVGFDLFDDQALLGLLDGDDRKNMAHLFQYARSAERSVRDMEGLLGRAGFGPDKFELIPGDVSETARHFVEERPGFRVCLLHMDLDVDKPTYAALSAFWDRVVPGGIVVFDEYGVDRWSESQAVDRFFKERNQVLRAVNFTKTPSAYIIKQ